MIVLNVLFKKHKSKARQAQITQNWTQNTKKIN
jgi:hypothetical protein